jgi:hypothetical protein
VSCGERGQGRVSGAPTSSVFNEVCPAGRQTDSLLRTAALGAAAGKCGLKQSLTDGHSLLSYENWVDLNPGNRVRVQRRGERPENGSVDDIADDASYFWVWLDDGRRRVLILEGDGSIVWIQALCPLSES